MGLRGPKAGAVRKAVNSGEKKTDLRVVKSAPCDPPELPEFMPDGNDWPKHTLFWWEQWKKDPLTADYRMSDWLDLIDCCVIHGQLWSGDAKAAAELRLRLARHGATKADRAQLRITYATAEIREDEATNRKKVPNPNAKSAYDRIGGLHAVKNDPAV